MARPDQFVTGLVTRVRLANGAVEIVNAGHPPPYRVRAGHVTELAVPAGAPLGVAGIGYETHIFQLAPGDRLVLVTDGFLDRNAEINFAKILEETGQRHPREVVRELAENVLEITGGNLRMTPRSCASTGTGRMANATPSSERAGNEPPEARCPPARQR